MKLYAESLLIGNQWHKNKTLVWDEQGIITSIIDGKADGAEIASGSVIPGMVNLHSHAFQRGFAGLSEFRSSADDSFWSWRKIMYQFVSRLTPEQAQVIAQWLYIEMLKAGYTTVAEFHYLHHQADGSPYENPAEMSNRVMQAAENAGIAMTLLPVLYTYAGFGHQPAQPQQGRFIHSTDAYLRLIEELLSKAKSPMLEVGIAPHSLRAVSAEQLKEVVPAIRQHSPTRPIHIHIAEQMLEVDDCKAFYGARPVEWLLENFPVDNHWCLVHATHLIREETLALAKSGGVAGLCPTTEASLGDGLFPAVEYLNSNGRWGIGSDSHISVNLIEELKLLEYGQRLKHQKRALLCEPPSSVGQTLYTQACQGGALAVDQPVGELGVGKRADLLVLNQEHPSLVARSEERLLDSLIFAADNSAIDSVMVAGNWKVRQGVHPDEDAIANRYRQVLAELLK